MIQLNEYAIFAFRGTLKTKDLFWNDYAFAHITTHNNTSFSTIKNNNHSDVTELILDKYRKAGLLHIKTTKEDFVFTGIYQLSLQYKNYIENLLKETF